MAHLNDFEVCNRYDIDNTGLVCKYFLHSSICFYFRGKVCISFLTKKSLNLSWFCSILNLMSVYQTHRPV